MGMIKFFSSSSFDDKPNVITKILKVFVNDNNPDPTKYKILQNIQVGNHLVIKINYPDCKNYEGNKILVFENCTLEDLKNQKIIDPHFSDNKNFKSPIARFEPTGRGWTWACNFVKNNS